MSIRIIRIIAVPASILLFSAVVVAQQPFSRGEKVQSAGELRVCIWPEYYSISYRNPRTGGLEGIDIAMARHFAADLGVAARFVDSSFRTLIDDLLNDRCDVSMHGVGATAARREKLAFSAPVLRSGIYAIASKRHPLIRSWGDIDRDGVIVVAQAGTYMEPVMRETLKKAELLVVQSPEAREQEVMSGRADVFVTDYPYSRKMLAIHDWAALLAPPQPLAPAPYAYAAAPGDDEWLATLDAFVARAKKDGRLAKAAADAGLTAIVVLE